MFTNLKNKFIFRRYKLLTLLHGKLAAAVALLCLGITHGSVIALPSDSEQALTLEAMSAEFDEARGITTYTGKVVMQQGSMMIHADKLIVHGKLDAVDKIIALGKPAKFQQTDTINAEPVRASANKLEYSIDNETLVLLGKAALDQEGSSLKSHRIEYDVKKALVKAGNETQQEENKDRVRMVIPPKAFRPATENTNDSTPEASPITSSSISPTP